MAGRFWTQTTWAAVLLLPWFPLAMLAGYWLVKDEVPQLPEDLRIIRQQPPTEIVSSDGEVLKVIGDRSHVPLELISRHFLKAIVAAEDGRFYHHHGIDPLGTLRALWVNLRNQESVQGGSTLTQQLAKNLFLSFEKSYSRKFKEMLLAFQIESTFSKKEILEAYSNQVYFGEGAYGVEDASLLYFGRRAKDLTLLQAAVLAGIPKSPSRYNPIASRSKALNRARYVLNRMVTEKLIYTRDREEALKSNLSLIERKTKSNPNQYFLDAVLTKLQKELGEEMLHFGSLRIFTTLNASMQRQAQKAVEQHLSFLKTRMAEPQRENPLETAVVTVDNASGAVRVLLGGADHSRSQFNRALSNNRMPGSSFKPFVYMAAFEHLGYHPATLLVDEPIIMNIPGIPPWKPRNYADSYLGPVVLKKALAHSLNSISAKLVYRLGPRRVIETARRFGITSPLQSNYSIALGASGVSPLELASAYSVIANLGIYREPFLISRVEDLGGKVLYEHFINNSRRFPRQTTYQLHDMMQGVVENGSGRVVRRLGFEHPAGGKTGTTNNYRDAWFTGFTRLYTTSVWVGHDNNEPLLGPNGKGMTGSQAAAPIWALLNKAIHQDYPVEAFPTPSGIRYETVDTNSGFIASTQEQAVRVALQDNRTLPHRRIQQIVIAPRVKPAIHQVTHPLPHPPFEASQTAPEGLPVPDSANASPAPNLETQTWFFLNLDSVGHEREPQIPPAFIKGFLQATRSETYQRNPRIQKARQIAIDQLLRNENGG